MARKIELVTYVLETTTNNQGRFLVLHGLEDYSPDGYAIRGINVAIQHKNKNWHTLEYSHNVDNRFWWNDREVAGIIGSPDFHNRPVRIVVFTEFSVG